MYITYLVEDDDLGQYAETILKKRLGFSQILLRKMKRYQALHINGEFALHKTRVKAGDFIEVSFVEESEILGNLEASPEIPILYEDAWIGIVDKPAGLPSHPRFEGDPGLSTSLGPKPVHMINRLDLDTSGLCLVGKNPYAHDILSRVPISKLYLALVHGILEEDSGRIDAPIARVEGSIIERHIADDGKEAISHFVTVARWEELNCSLLGFRLETGRTHQIRVHAKHIGHPLVGDTLYGINQMKQIPNKLKIDKAITINKLLDRQFLHASRLVFKQVIINQEIDIRAKLPRDLTAVLQYLNANERAIFSSVNKEELLELKIAARNIQNNALEI